MGNYSLLLLIGATNGLILAGLVATVRSSPANRLLALLIAAVALRLSPFVLGYAGLYDAHRWLTFAPFDLSWAYGPLLWGYVTRLTTGALSRQWLRHLAPAAIQLAYQVVCFTLPMAAKWDWYTGPHLHVLAPLGAAVGLALAALYLSLSIRAVRRYRTWLDIHYANQDAARLGWLYAMLAAFGLTLLVAAGFALTSWLVRPLDYFARFPLMLVFAALIYGLGLLGWRHTAVAYPLMVAEAELPPAPMAAHGDAYRTQAEAWRARLVDAGWWREETLDLACLASRLAVSQRTLSRGLAQGAGQNFREFIGRIRIDAVVSALALPENDRRDLLSLAFEAGFNSKASFNRAFRLYAGGTPTEVRRRVQGARNRQSTALADREAQ